MLAPPKPTFLWLSCWFSCWCLCVRGRDMQIGRGIADKRKYCILIVCQRQRHANNFVHIYRLVVSKGIADKNVSDCFWWWNFVFSWHLHDNASCSKQWSIDRRNFFSAMDGALRLSQAFGDMPCTHNAGLKPWIRIPVPILVLGTANFGTQQRRSNSAMLV